MNDRLGFEIQPYYPQYNLPFRVLCVVCHILGVAWTFLFLSFPCCFRILHRLFLRFYGLCSYLPLSRVLQPHFRYDTKTERNTMTWACVVYSAYYSNCVTAARIKRHYFGTTVNDRHVH